MVWPNAMNMTSLQRGTGHFTQLRSESSSYLLHAEIKPPTQKESQRSTIPVSNFCGNLFDTCLAGLQEVHRAFNTQTLKIRHRRFPKYVL